MKRRWQDYGFLLLYTCISNENSYTYSFLAYFSIPFPSPLSLSFYLFYTTNNNISKLWRFERRTIARIFKKLFFHEDKNRNTFHFPISNCFNNTHVYFCLDVYRERSIRITFEYILLLSRVFHQFESTICLNT